MKEILEIIIKNLVSNPDDVKITKEEGEKPNTVIFKVECNKSDMGKVIGKNGKVAHAIREVIKSLGQSQKQKIYVEFVD